MRVIEKNRVWIVAASVLLVVAACGRNYDTETQDVTVMLNPGTELAVAPLKTLSPLTEDAGNEFTAVLREPLMIDGEVVAPEGTSVLGEIVEAHRAEEGDEEGSFLSLRLSEVLVSGGQAIAITTEPVRYTPRGQAAGMTSEETTESAEQAQAETEREQGITPPPVVPEDEVVTFRLSEAVEFPVVVAPPETVPIS